MTDSKDDRYFARVEEHFGRRRGGPVVLSPKDWKLLEKWFARGVPLPVVLRGINQAFDRFAAAGPRSDRINSLRYCEQEVEAAWEEHRVANTGRSDAGDSSGEGLPGAGPHLRAVAEACRNAADAQRRAEVGDTLRAVADELEALAVRAGGGEVDAVAVDARATALQERLAAKLATQPGETRLDDLKLPPFSPYDF